jgi:NAD(P)-dependent dehydrogenase (short-subunit alcohol dehydrogenase family)
MMGRMSGRVVVVTGARGGIGLAIAECFTQHGDLVVGLDVLDGFDVRDAEACRGEAARIESEVGPVEVLCNNAGVSAVGDVVVSTPDDWERVFAVNVFGVANMSRAFLPAMRRRRRGAVVNTCSVVASVGLVERAVYGASKGAVLSLTKAMAADEIAHGIRVNCVSPGTVWSPWVQGLAGNSADPDATVEVLRRRQPHGRVRRGRGRRSLPRGRFHLHDGGGPPARRWHHRCPNRGLSRYAGGGAARRAGGRTRV